MSRSLLVLSLVVAASTAGALERTSAHEKQVRSTRRALERRALGRDAAQFALVPAPGIEQRRLSNGAPRVFGVSSSQARELEVTSSDGRWRGSFVSSAGAHFLSGPDAGFKDRLRQAVKGDRVVVSYDYGHGTPETIVAKRRSGVTNRIDLDIPLNPEKSGPTRVRYTRENDRGEVVSDPDWHQQERVEILRQKAE